MRCNQDEHPFVFLGVPRALHPSHRIQFCPRSCGEAVSPCEYSGHQGHGCADQGCTRAQEYAVPPARYTFSMLLLPLRPGASASAGDAAAAAWRQQR